MRVFACYVVSKLQRHRCPTFGALRFRTNRGQTDSYIFIYIDNEITGVMSLLWTFMPQQRIKLMMWRTVSMRNWNVYSINSLNSVTVFSKQHMKMLLEDLNTKVGREDMFRLTIGNDNGVRVVKFATSKNFTVKSTMFPHRNIHKYTSRFIIGFCILLRVIKGRNMSWVQRIHNKILCQLLRKRRYYL
jgi:hypothetical protein